MKKFLFLFSLLALHAFTLFAQEEDKSIFQPVVIIGFNATQVAGDDLAGYRKIGANTGAGVFIRLPKNNIPRRTTEPGAINAQIMNAAIGKRIFSRRETWRGAFIRIKRSFFVVSNFMIGG